MESRTHIPTETIIKLVLDYAEHTFQKPFTIEQLSQRDNRYFNVTTRLLLYYGLRTYCKLYVAEIGSMVNKHHTTVLHGWERFDNGAYKHDMILKYGKRTIDEFVETVPKPTTENPTFWGKVIVDFSYDNIIDIMSGFEQYVKSDKKASKSDKALCAKVREFLMKMQENAT